MARRKATSWVPSAHQARMLETAKECGLQRTITAMCLEANVSRPTFYEWMKCDPSFVKAWEAIPKDLLDKHLPGIYSALVRKALDGDVPAIKLALELVGRYTPAIQKLEVKHEGRVDLSVLSDDDLRSLEEVASKLAERGRSVATAGGNGDMPAQAN